MQIMSIRSLNVLIEIIEIATRAVVWWLELNLPMRLLSSAAKQLRFFCLFVFVFVFFLVCFCLVLFYASQWRGATDELCQRLTRIWLHRFQFPIKLTPPPPTTNGVEHPYLLTLLPQQMAARIQWTARNRQILYSLYMGNVNCHRYRRNHVCREYWLYTDTKLEHQLK